MVSTKVSLLGQQGRGRKKQRESKRSWVSEEGGNLVRARVRVRARSTVRVRGIGAWVDLLFYCRMMLTLTLILDLTLI